MTGFTYEGTDVTVTDEIAQSHRDAWTALSQPGTWWTGAERLAIAARARAMFKLRDTPPWARQSSALDAGTSGGAGLPGTAVEAVDRLALDAGSIDRAWAGNMTAALGDGRYVELIAVVAITVMIDVFAEAVGAEPEPFPAPVPGEPSRERPDGLGDIGAHVQALDPFPAANVARALSLVPQANKLFRTVSVPTYSAPGFSDLAWETPLSRPQVELIAARVAAMNECFY